MIVVLTLAVIVFGCVTGRVRRAGQQAAAIDVIMQESKHNECRYDYQMTDELIFDFPVINSTAKSTVPPWLLNWFGVDFFHTVEFVEVSHSRA